VKSKSIYWKYVLLKIKYLFLRDSYVCTRWIFIFDSDQAQINSVGHNLRSDGSGKGQAVPPGMAGVVQLRDTAA
jgi:hypothetical protein